MSSCGERSGISPECKQLPLLHRGPGRPPNALKQHLQQLTPTQQPNSQQSAITSVLRAHLSPNFPAHLNTHNQQLNKHQQPNQIISTHVQQKQQLVQQKQLAIDPQSNLYFCFIKFYRLR